MTPTEFQFGPMARVFRPKEPAVPRARANGPGFSVNKDKQAQRADNS